MNYEMIKRNYDRGLWTKAMVRMAVRKGLLTAAQFTEITGEAY
ncbi:MAG: XkdX family protein [Clostridiaceae bacterium]|nr:XkdX family protein [Clostridiaceae bacterium]